MISPAVIAALLPLAGFAAEIRAVLRTARPVRVNRMSWLLWAVAPLIVSGAELSQHAPGAVILLTFGLGAGPALVFLAAMTRPDQATRLTWFDLGCGAASAGALALWAVTGHSWLAIIMSVAADGCAALPTVADAWTGRGEEGPVTFLATLAGSALTLGITRRWTLAGCAFPLYAVIVCTVIAIPATWRAARKLPAGTAWLAAAVAAACAVAAVTTWGAYNIAVAWGTYRAAAAGMPAVTSAPGPVFSAAEPSAPGERPAWPAARHARRHHRPRHLPALPPR